MYEMPPVKPLHAHENLCDEQHSPVAVVFARAFVGDEQFMPSAMCQRCVQKMHLVQQSIPFFSLRLRENDFFEVQDEFFAVVIAFLPRLVNMSKDLSLLCHPCGRFLVEPLASLDCNSLSTEPVTSSLHKCTSSFTIMPALANNARYEPFTTDGVASPGWRDGQGRMGGDFQAVLSNVGFQSGMVLDIESGRPNST